MAIYQCDQCLAWRKEGDLDWRKGECPIADAVVDICHDCVEKINVVEEIPQGTSQE